MRYYKKYVLKEEVDDDASSFDKSLTGVGTADINDEEDVSFTKFKNRRQEIYNIVEQSESLDDSRSDGSNSEEFPDENQNATERDDVNNEPSTNKNGDSPISQQMKYRSDDRMNDINLKSQGHSDVTVVLENFSKSSGDESSAKIDEEGLSSDQRDDSGDSFVAFIYIADHTVHNCDGRYLQTIVQYDSP